MGPLPEGISYIMRMTLLTSKFRDLDLTRKSILFLSSPCGGESLIRVTTTLVTSTSSVTLSLTKRLLTGGGIGRYPFLIGGVTVIGGGLSNRQTSSTAPSRTAPR